MDQAITALGKTGFKGVYAMNDGTAGGAIAAMQAAGIDPKTVPTTGQDAELEAVQRILTGDQYMTVYKATKPEAETAAKIAVALANGKPIPPTLRHDEDQQRVDRRPVLPAHPGCGDEGQRRPRSSRTAAYSRRRIRRLLDSPRSAPRSSSRPASRPESARQVKRTESPNGAGETSRTAKARCTDADASPRAAGSPRASGPFRPSRRRLRGRRAARSSRLVGDNGAGKSTLIKAIAACSPPTPERSCFERQAGQDQQTPRPRAPRHRDRLPGPRAVRQPRRGREPLPRQELRRTGAAARDRRGRHGAARGRAARASCR